MLVFLVHRQIICVVKNKNMESTVVYSIFLGKYQHAEGTFSLRFRIYRGVSESKRNATALETDESIPTASTASAGTCAVLITFGRLVTLRFSLNRSQFLERFRRVRQPPAHHHRDSVQYRNETDSETTASQSSFADVDDR